MGRYETRSKLRRLLDWLQVVIQHTVVVLYLVVKLIIPKIGFFVGRNWAFEEHDSKNNRNQYD